MNNPMPTFDRNPPAEGGGDPESCAMADRAAGAVIGSAVGSALGALARQAFYAGITR